MGEKDVIPEHQDEDIWYKRRKKNKLWKCAYNFISAWMKLFKCVVQKQKLLKFVLSAEASLRMWCKENNRISKSSLTPPPLSVSQQHTMWWIIIRLLHHSAFVCVDDSLTPLSCLPCTVLLFFSSSLSHLHNDSFLPWQWFFLVSSSSGMWGVSLCPCSPPSLPYSPFN